MEICVNEYVRTKNGYIARLKEKSENCWNFDNTIIDSYTETSLLFGEDNCYGYDQRENIIKHSKNIIDLIEDEDIVILEYKSPKYRERITRKFNVCIIDNDINFENSYCDFRCKIGDEKIKDDICKNIKIKSVVTKEQFSNIEYIVEE